MMCHMMIQAEIILICWFAAQKSFFCRESVGYL